MFRSALLLSSLLPGALLAQIKTVVVPPVYGTKPGNSLDQQPLGLDQIRHAQYVDGSYLPGMSNGSLVNEIRYRREENRLDKIDPNYEPMQRGVRTIPRWQIRLGNAVPQYDQLVPEYDHAKNGTTWTAVFAASLNLQVNTPPLAAPASPANPAPFDIKFPFNVQQFQYTGGTLTVEHYAYEQRNATHIYYVDAVQSDAKSGGSVGLITPTSVGCPPDFNRVHGTAPNPGGGNLALHLFGAPASTPVLCFFGESATSWNGLPLPTTLGFMGMASCSIHTDLSVPLATTTDLAGIATIELPIPANPLYAGVNLFNQWAVADQRVNPAMGFALSDGVKITLGSQVGIDSVFMTVISGEGNVAGNRFGYLQPNRGAVFQLIYQ